mgnify:FL=1|jgi:hypothetical protein
MNITEKEKKIRLFSGGILFFVSIKVANIFLLLLSLLLVHTGYYGWCPIYATLGENSFFKSYKTRLSFYEFLKNLAWFLVWLIALYFGF